MVVPWELKILSPRIIKGLTVFKIVIWGGKSLVFWSEILFYSNMSAEL